jgi:hypothetical protein
MPEDTPRKLEKIAVDKDRFDAILRKMADTKPLPVKDLIGTFPKLNSQKAKPRK